MEDRVSDLEKMRVRPQRLQESPGRKKFLFFKRKRTQPRQFGGPTGRGADPEQDSLRPMTRLLQGDCHVCNRAHGYKLRAPMDHEVGFEFDVAHPPEQMDSRHRCT